MNGRVQAEKMTDELPHWLTTKEATFKVALWLLRQDDPALHHMRVRCELAEVAGDAKAAGAPQVTETPRRFFGDRVAEIKNFSARDRVR